jgi:hypothetical protein
MKGTVLICTVLYIYITACIIALQLVYLTSYSVMMYLEIRTYIYTQMYYINVLYPIPYFLIEVINPLILYYLNIVD